MSLSTPQIIWHDIQSWGVEGKGWTDTEQYFDRLPAAARRQVRPAVWDLSRHTAGMSARFITDATILMDGGLLAIDGHKLRVWNNS
mgnify:CR=1 FL=1